MAWLYFIYMYKQPICLRVACSDVEEWSISDVEKFLIYAKYQQYTTLFQQQICYNVNDYTPCIHNWILAIMEKNSLDLLFNQELTVILSL